MRSRSGLLCLLLSLLLPLPAPAEDKPPAEQPPVLVAQEVEGWSVVLGADILREENREGRRKAMTALANHLQRIKYIVPEDRLEKLVKLPIWIEWHNEKLASMQYHPDRGWLIGHGHDPRLARHVHIPRAADLYNPATWAKHPYVVLHELAHAYHDQVLSFDDPEVIKVYDAAKEKKLYDKVLLYTGQHVRHYALTNHKEYFAEMTEAYFGVNDFYPFVRAELKEHDPAGFALMETVWGKVR
jgi:hypothetical protein